MAQGFWHPVARQELGGGELSFEDEGVGGSGKKRLLEKGCADLIAGDLEDLTVLDSARAGGFTGSATEALVEMGLGFVPGELAVNDASDEVDSSPRRVELVAGLGECGAVFEAESAPDALGGEVF